MQFSPSLNGNLSVILGHAELNRNTAFVGVRFIGDKGRAGDVLTARISTDVDRRKSELSHHSRISVAGFVNRTVIRPAGSRKPAGGDGEARI